MVRQFIDPFEDYMDEKGKLHGRIYTKDGMFCYFHGLQHSETGAAKLLYNRKGYPCISEWWLFGEEITREMFQLVTKCPEEKLPLLMGLRKGIDRYIAERLSNEV